MKFTAESHPHLWVEGLFITAERPKRIVTYESGAMLGLVNNKKANAKRNNPADESFQI